MDTATPEAVRYLMGLQELVRAPDRLKPETVIAPAGGSAPTIVVAASNTSLLTQMKADYAAGSPDATDMLLIALQDLLSRGGGRLVVCEGYYEIASPLPISGGVTIEGMNRQASIFKIPDGATGFDMFPVSDGAFTLTRMLLDGNKAAVSGAASGVVASIGGLAQLTIHDVEIQNFDGFGIYSSRSAGVNMISDVDVHDCGGDGVWLEGEGDHFLEGVRSGANGSDGFNVTGSRVKMVNCQARGNAHYGLLHSGLVATAGLTLIGNQFEQNGLSGMNLISVGGGIHTVVGNRSSENGQYGFEFGDSSNRALATGNVASANILSGFLVGGSATEGWTIVGNESSHNGQHGIHLAGSGKHGIIASNRFSTNSQTTDNTYDGIFVDTDADDYFITGNKVWTNPLATNQQRYGINVSAGTNDTIAVVGNDARASGQTGNYNNAGTGTVNVWAGAFGDNL